MIYRLKGIIIEKRPDFVAIDIHGIAYGLYISLTTFNELPPIYSETTLYTHLIHKEDKMDLYGFHTKETLNFFKLLIALSGVGPKLALILLSNLSPSDLKTIVRTQNKDRLKRISGVGPKKAEKIIFELKGKLKNITENPDESISSFDEDAFLALTSLGYSNKEAQEVLNKPEIQKLSTLEEKLKSSLNILNKG